MHLSDRRPGSPNNRRRAKFRPWAESLEARQLLATLDLATTQSAPLGVELVGQNNTGATNTVTGAGYTITDVGDLTGSGYDDFVVAAPGVSNTTPITTGNPTFTGTSTVYLIFGSQAVNSSTITDWATLPASQRAGDLGQLGGLGSSPPGYQVNPTVTQPTNGTLPFVGFNFNGLTLTTGAVPASGLGYSVTALGDIDGSGHNSFAIGAPNDTGGGRVYIIYGSTALAALATGTTQTTKTLDLEPTTGTSGLVSAGVKVVTLFDSQTGTNDAAAGSFGLQFGYSVGGLGNYLNFAPTGPKDVAIGAPGYNGNDGAAFAISGLGLNSVASGAVVDVSTLVANNSYAIQYTGTPGLVARAGSSVSGAGDFDGYKVPTSNFTVDDFLIGAPGLIPTGGGQTYLVYGHQVLAQTNGIKDSTQGTVQQLSQIGTVPTASPLFNPLEGVIFKNSVGSGLSGFSVDTAGDFNGDGLGDVIIGAPGGTTSSASIYYGVGQYTATSNLDPGHIVGNYTSPTFLPSTLTIPLPLIFTDQSAVGDEFGFSVSYIGDIPGEGINGVAVGAPMTNSGLGAAYVIPGNYETPTTSNTTTFPSQVLITTAITSPTYAALQLTTSNSFNGGTATNPPFLGTSVSGRTPLIPTTGTDSQQFTVDKDAIPDLFVGAPGFNLADPATGNTTVARTMAGEGFALEGADLGILAPDNVILTTAGVNSNVPGASYTASPTGANTFFIFSSAATSTVPAFDPTTDLTSPVTLTINGVTFTNVTLTDGKDSTGTDDASFTLTAAQTLTLGLTAGTTITITIKGTTTANTVFVARATTVAVSSGGSGGGSSGGAGLVGATAAAILTPPLFTGTDYGLPSPPISSLEHLISYQPLPVTIAYQQFLPQPGFLAREEVAIHPSKKGGAHQAPAGTVLNVSAIAHSENKYSKKPTLLKAVFTRGKFKTGVSKTITYTHKQKVIPRSEQTESITY